MLDDTADQVIIREEQISIPTYRIGKPEKNPMFLEKRVYQGSSGEVYPLPFIDRIATSGVPRLWSAIHIENRYLRVMILPEIGGRIHVGLDRNEFVAERCDGACVEIVFEEKHLIVDILGKINVESTCALKKKLQRSILTRKRWSSLCS